MKLTTLSTLPVVQLSCSGRLLRDMLDAYDLMAMLRSEATATGDAVRAMRLEGG